jgi:hypothetical protein
VCRQDRGIPVCQQHIGILAQRLLGAGPHPIGVTRAPFKVDLKIYSDRPTGLLEFTSECGGAKLSLWIVLGYRMTTPIRRA